MNKNWILVKEKLPEGEQMVIAYDGRSICMVSRIEGIWCDLDDPDLPVDVQSCITHWMPLPEPPG